MHILKRECENHYPCYISVHNSVSDLMNRLMWETNHTVHQLMTQLKLWQNPVGTDSTQIAHVFRMCVVFFDHIYFFDNSECLGQIAHTSTNFWRTNLNV